MIGWHAWGTGHGCMGFNDYCEEIVDKEMNLKEMWLAFYMHEVHNKTWEKGEWA